MEEILKYLMEQLTALGYPGIVALLAAISAGCSTIVKLAAKLQIVYRQRKLNRDLFPWYTGMEIQRATQYYVETKGQNVAPSKHEEPSRGYGKAMKESIHEIRYHSQFFMRPPVRILFARKKDSPASTRSAQTRCR